MRGPAKDLATKPMSTTMKNKPRIRANGEKLAVGA